MKNVKSQKRRRLTLIELMIVIAIIGILAVVLVPKISGSKDTAKEAGVLANAKSVEVFVSSNINKWSKNTETAANIKTFLDTATSGMTNPYTGGVAYSVDVTGTPVGGIVTVKLSSTPLLGTSADSITLTGHGLNGTTITTVFPAEVIKP